MELFTPELGLIFWMFVAFAVLFFVLAKWGWPAILKMVESRADLIDEARRQQAEMLRDADRMKTQIIEEARQAATAEAQKVMDAAKVSIQQERKEAELRIRDEVSQFALEIATKVVRQQMADNSAQKKLVNTLLDEIEKQN